MCYCVNRSWQNIHKYMRMEPNMFNACTKRNKQIVLKIVIKTIICHCILLETRTSADMPYWNGVMKFIVMKLVCLWKCLEYLDTLLPLRIKESSYLRRLLCETVWGILLIYFNYFCWLKSDLVVLREFAIVKGWVLRFDCEILYVKQKI